MLKSLRIFALCVFAVGLMAGFYFLPTDVVVSETGNSPLYTASLTSTTDHLNGASEPVRGSDGKGGGAGNLITCEVTCGPTCNQTTCGTTCVATCQFTCANTCSQTTCEATCVATCANTCANTCSQTTCASTCVVTCSYTCEEPISLISFTAETQDNHVVISWTTGSEVDTRSFIIMRSTSPEGQFAQLQEVNATGGSVTTSYTYVDASVTPGNTYFYKITDVTVSGYPTVHDVVASATVASEYVMVQNYPNPFNPDTVIRFNLPVSAQTQLNVYDMSGRLVRTLVNGTVNAGTHQVTWNATDNAGNVLPSGMYVYRLAAGELTASGKMVYVK